MLQHLGIINYSLLLWLQCSTSSSSWLDYTLLAQSSALLNKQAINMASPESAHRGSKASWLISPFLQSPSVLAHLLLLENVLLVWLCLPFSLGPEPRPCIFPRMPALASSCLRHPSSAPSPRPPLSFSESFNVLCHAFLSIKTKNLWKPLSG